MPAGFALADAAGRTARVAAVLLCVAVLSLGIEQPLQGGLLVAIAVAAAIWPVETVLATIAAIPVTRVAAATLAGIGGATVELLVLATACGYLARRAISPMPRIDDRRTRAAVFVLGAIVAGSLVVELAGVRVLISPQVFWSSLTGEAIDYAARARPDVAGRFSALPAALTLLQGLLLFSIVMTLPGGQPTATRALRMFVAGATAAGALNVMRFAGAVLRSDAPGETALHLLRTVRISMAYGDVNAAGSFFVLALLAAIGFAIEARGASRAVYAAASAVCAMALWLSGSRTAFLALIFVAGLWLVWRGGRRAWRILPIAAIVALIGIRAFPNPIIDPTSVGALSIRLELARASFRLLREAPVFGVGVGQFYPRSGSQIRDPWVRSIYPRENAHNNFLQILAELGIAGFAAFLLVIGSVLARVRSSGTGLPGHMAGAIAGLTAFLISCLAGHPLLTPDVSLVFWTVLGIAASSYAGDSGRRWPIAALAIIGLVALTLPFRIANETRALNLARVAYGLPDWEYDGRGEAFRRMSETVTLFIPADATTIELPYRLLEDGQPATIEVRFGGRGADRLIVTEQAWRVYRATVARSSSDTAFIPLELRVSSGSASSVGLGQLVTRRDRDGPR